MTLIVTMTLLFHIEKGQLHTTQRIHRINAHIAIFVSKLNLKIIIFTKNLHI